LIGLIETRGQGKMRTRRWIVGIDGIDGIDMYPRNMKPGTRNTAPNIRL